MNKILSLFVVFLVIGGVDKEGHAFPVSCLNPSFEDGLNSWTVSGDAASAAAIENFEGVIFPPDGAAMAMISTANDTAFETTLSQRFAPLANDLRFSINFLTRETNLFNDPFYPSNDTLTINAFSGGASLASLILDTFSSHLFPSAATGFLETGFVPFIAPAGTDELVFSITDIGDPARTSIGLIDDPRCTATCKNGTTCTANCEPWQGCESGCRWYTGNAYCECTGVPPASVPEPATLLLMAAGLVPVIRLSSRSREQRLNT